MKLKFKRFKASKAQEKKEWYEYCKNHQVPYIVISIRSSYADVEFDYITYTDTNIAKILCEKEEFIKQKSLEIFERYATRKSVVKYCGWALIKIDNILISQADEVALEIYKLVTAILGDYKSNKQAT